VARTLRTLLIIRCRKPVASIDLTISDEEIISAPSNQSKSDAKKRDPKSPRTLSTIRKYFLRKLPAKLEDNDNTSDEDTEDLMSKLSAYKLLSEGNYGCELCRAKNVRTIMDKKALIVRHLLRAHTYCHSYECSSCSSSFKKKNWLKNHCETEHGETDSAKLFECARCEHRSKDEDLLRLHALRKHAAIYRYVCKCCAKCFKTGGARNEHEKAKERRSRRRRRRSQPKPPRYVCDLCNHLLRTKQELVAHLRDLHSENFYKNVRMARGAAAAQFSGRAGPYERKPRARRRTRA
jgi:hypothetical protein